MVDDQGIESQSSLHGERGDARQEERGKGVWRFKLQPFQG